MKLLLLLLLIITSVFASSNKSFYTDTMTNDNASIILNRPTSSGTLARIEDIINLTTNVSGILPRANGGTGLSASGTTGNVLTSNGTNWVSSPLATGISSPSDVYYVDGNLGNDSTTTGTQAFPCLTIQRCINLSGQPVNLQDALRHIEIHVSGKQALPAALFSGIYTENLTVPNRFMDIFGFGVKLDGNILKEYSSSRRFGASSSEFRPTLTLIGLNETRDSHPRIRNGFHVGGTNRTSILTRNTDSVQGNGTNKVTIHVTAGQFTYPITVSSPAIRIKVNNTTNYNFTYDITADLGGNTFEATRVSGTNASVSVETGNFFESDSAGASGITHDSHFINTYQQGAYTCDDGTVNGAAYTAGTEVLYSVGSRWFTGMEGRGILLQRWENNTLAGASIVNSISGMNNNTFAGTITTSTFTYATDDQGFTNNRFNSAVPITVSSAAQTVRMDGVTHQSFVSSGSSWITNTPTIAFLGYGTLSTTGAVDFASIIAGASNDQTLTVAGAVAGASVVCGLPATQDANLTVECFVSAANTVTLRAHNVSLATTVDQVSKTYKVSVMQ